MDHLIPLGSITKPLTQRHNKIPECLDIGWLEIDTEKHEGEEKALLGAETLASKTLPSWNKCQSDEKITNDPGWNRTTI
jgi:hypothetical protein